MSAERGEDQVNARPDALQVVASGPGAVAIGGNNSGSITTTVIMPGSGRSSIWLETDRFFALHIGVSLYSHDWPLVGRGPELYRLLEWLDGPGQGVGVLEGRGGLGKSRLLRAFAESATTDHGYAVRFLDRTVAVQPEDIEVLPADGNLLIVVDDTHESPNVASLVSGIRRARPAAKILLATRPYGVARLWVDLRAAGVHQIEVPHWQLTDLSFAEATDLAGAVLGSGHDTDVARRLAVIGRDCPLIIVVGGGLIRQGMLDADRVTNDDVLRDEVMKTFAKTLTADAAGAQPGLRAEVLRAVAALQPFRLNEPAFREAIEALADKPFDQILPQIRDLEDAGILLRREDAVRVVPDLLGDAILADAIVDIRSGADTGYLERVLPVVDGEAFLNLVFNATRVDWTVRHRGAEPRPSLVDGLWDNLVADFEAAGAHDRLALLGRLDRVAFYQPAALLRMSQIAFETSGLDKDTQLRNKIRFALPPVLEKAALDLEQFAASVDLLWELARQDTRADRREEDHPFRVLVRLAEFKRWKPLAFNIQMLAAVKRWMAARTDGMPATSPLDLLHPLLATEGTEEESDGIRLTLKQFQVEPVVVSALRQEVVGLVLDGLWSSDRREALRAADALGKAFQYPHGFYGHTVPVERQDEWTPDFLDTLGRLRTVMTTRSIDPVVAIAIRRSLRWHARYAPGATKAAAQSVLDVLPNAFDYEIAIALHGSWDELTDEVSDFYEANRVRAEKLEALAEQALSVWPEDAVLSELSCRLQAERDFGSAGGQANSEPFVRALLRRRPSLARDLVAAVTDEPDSLLVNVLPLAVQELLLSDADAGWAAVRKLLDQNHLTITRLTASGLSRYRGGERPADGREQTVLRELLDHGDETARCLALQAVRGLGESDRNGAAELVLSVSFGRSLPVANEVLSAFGRHGYLSFDDLGSVGRDRLLTGIAELASIEEYEVQIFLSELSAVHPQEVLQLLQRRAFAGKERSAAAYRALPHHWQESLRFRDAPGFSEFLADALGWLSANLDRVRVDDGGALIAVVAGAYDADVRTQLLSAAEVGEVSDIKAVARALAYVPRAFVWEHPDFVGRILHAADRHGDECRADVQSALSRSVYSSGFGGAVGEPFPQDVEQRDRSRAVAATLAEESLERAFYDGLAKAAEAHILAEINIERRSLENRDW